MQLKRNQTKAGILLLLAMMVFASCEDVYEYDNKEPDFLGNSIYEYLEADGGFTYFVRLIDDLGYKEVLSRTGSKTLFAVRDGAFQRFLANNSYGVQTYEGLSYAQKRQILNASLLNMAYLSYMLANATESESLGEGAALRRDASYTYLDSIAYVQDPILFANPFWSQFQGKGAYLIDNEDPVSMIHFNQANMTTHHISSEDFSVIHNGAVFQPGDLYVNGIRVEEQDIICKNGYIHVVEELLTPLKNMSQIIRDNGQTTLFNRLLNLFCMPYYSENLSRDAHQYYDGSSPERPLIPASDSVFVKRYLTADDFNTDANGNSMSDYGLLHFDPSDNNYGSQREMGVMFVPTDEAMEAYINGERGEYLKNVYGSWENVPTSILALFLKNHQKKNFTSALPHAWPAMNDESSYPMYVDAKHVRRTYLATNGVVYLTDEVYPPVDYQSVFASVMTTTSSQVMNWAIRDEGMKFFYYLRSMDNMYNLLVPTDEALQNYRDPIAWALGGAARRIWAFRYVPTRNQVFADLYAVDEEGNKTGNVVSTITDQGTVKNRLKDIVDMHIVVGEKTGDQMWGYLNEGGIRYALTKGGATIQVEGTGDQMTVTGGGDLERQVAPAEIVVNPVTGKKDIYDSRNGRTYFIDKVVQDPVKSLYTVLGEHPEYEAFFQLLNGDDRVFNLFAKDKDVVSVFDLKKVGSTSGLGYVVNSFNNFRYTVFVPTESALEAAFAANDKLFTWDEIAEDEDLDRKKEKTLYLLKFLKYHFMDNAVFIDGQPFDSPLTFETAARNPSEKFYKLIVNGNGSDLQVANENQTIRANVIKQAGTYNVMARDCIVNNATYANATQIVSSSRSVVHLIDKALDFDK